MMCFPNPNWQPYEQRPRGIPIATGFSQAKSQGFGQDYAQNKMKDLSDMADIGFAI